MCRKIPFSSFLLRLLLLCTIYLSSCFGQAVENHDASNLTVPRFYTFASDNSHILLSANGDISKNLIYSKKEITFDFRTRYPNGILLYETFYLNSTENNLYNLFLVLENSRFKVLLEYETQQLELLIGYGFNDDLLHRVNLYMNLKLGLINIHIDSNENPKHYKTMYFNSTFLENINSFLNCRYKLCLGAIPVSRANSKHDPNKYKNFVGCLGNFNIVSRSSMGNFGTLASSQLHMNSVVEGCVDQCKKLNLCSRKSRCVNYYDHKECDCFATELEDWHCRSYNYTTVTLRGYSSISCEIYKFADKSYSNQNLISLHLRTHFDGLLVAALSESLQSYLILNIKNGFLNIMFNLYKNPKNYIFNDFSLTDGEWHNVTLNHQSHKILISFDAEVKHIISLEETNPFFFFDPEIYVGGFPSNLNISGLNLPLHLPNKKFAGCLKHVYFNNINVLYKLNNGYREAKHHSLFPLELGCSQVNSIPITIQPKSFFVVPLNKTDKLLLEFEFKSSKMSFKIATGTFVTKDNEKRKWYLFIRNEDVKLFIESTKSNSNQIGWTLSNDNSLNFTVWNKIKIITEGGSFFQMSVNQFVVKGRYDIPIDNFYGNVTFGSIDNNKKFLGCVKNVIINDETIEPRTLIEQYLVVGKVTIDNCQMLNPCNRPDVCEHGGVCVPIPENGTFFCDCSNTGYIGKTCHFSVYRKSCEEIYLMEKQHSGIYMIDIDRNGPLPPAHVICDLTNNSNGSISIRTVVEHNIQHQMIVREKGKSNSFYMDVIYRDFSVEMLRLLVMRSKQCKQYVRYECNNAPLSLSTYTLLFSTLKDHKVVSIEGNNAEGCACGGKNNVCVDPSKQCNCDANTPGWKRDEGFLTSFKDVGITKMFFLQFPNTSSESEAHLFLGNLSCIDLNTQHYEITFKTKESYLEVPGWRGKEMGISFRTTANRAVIFYQAHLDTVTTYFKAVIISENEVSFEYVLRNKKHVVTVSSSHCLNCGKWQHIWIERNKNQMRVSINQNFRIMYLPDNQNFIDFDGQLFVGGAPLKYLKGLKITLGFIGCLRGLIFDNEVVNLYNYLSHVRKPNIESGCRPYCKANLCQNQGVCIELWGSYQCKCANPIAHSGRNCEVNINENGITFKQPTAIRQMVESSQEIRSILQQDIILSFRTHTHYALLLYAHDVHNNFVQIHIENGTSVVLTYNTMKRIVRRQLVIGSLLVSGHTVQVKVDRNHKNSSMFIVNRQSVSIPYSVKFLNEFSFEKPWLKKGQEHELVKLNIDSNWTQNELFIGGVESEEATSMIPGFVGCIQGLVVGKKLLDIEKIGQQMNLANISTVKPGCKMLCDQMPCKNGGICTEDWENDSTKCECESTSYRGKVCDTDIGANFQKNSSVLFYLDNTILDFDNIDITFAFSSSNKENSTLFFLRYANSTRYLHIALLSNGNLIVEEDNGHDTYWANIESEEDNFLDTYRHWIHYTRKGRTAQIIVDSVIYLIGENDRETPPIIPETVENIIIIGSSRVNNNHNSAFNNFRGCISNINISLDNLRIDPLESAFGMRSGLNKVKVFGNINQGICASFRIHRSSVSMMQIDQTLTLTNREEIWLNRPKPSLMIYERNNKHDKSPKFLKTEVIMLLCVGYLSVVIVFISIYIWKIDKKYKLLKFQGETPFFHKKHKIRANT